MIRKNEVKKYFIILMIACFSMNCIPSEAIHSKASIKETNQATTKAIRLEGDVNLRKGNQLVSVSLRDSDVKQVLRMFADKAGLNIIFHNSVEGTVTLDLVNVTLNNAFKMIMKANELAFFIENDTLIVSSKEADKTIGMSKTNLQKIPVKYTDASSIATFLNENIFKNGRPGISSGEVALTNPKTNELLIIGSNNDYNLAKKVVEQLDTKPSISTFKVNHVTPREMANLICNTIFATNTEETNTIEDDSSDDDIDIDEQDMSFSNSSMSDSGSSSSSMKNIKLGSGRLACKVNSKMEMTDLKPLDINAISVIYYPELGNVGVIGGSVEQIQLIEDFIKNNDKKQPQAYVELQIIELNEEGSKQFNNEWKIWTPFFSASFDTTNGLITNPLNPTFLAGSGYNVVDSAGKITQTIQKYKGATTITQSLQYLVQNKKGRVLANPKVVVTNGRVSTIDLSSDYIKKVTSEVMSGVMVGATQKDYEIGEDNGMTIQLVPFISADGYVAMNIKPSYSTIKERVYSKNASTGADEIAATLLQRRNLNLSNIRIKDGETLILGGLVQENETKTTTKMPILGDIPLLGMFFRGSNNVVTNSELLILITPRIIKDSEDFENSDMVNL